MPLSGCILDVKNENLSATQNDLLRWHFKLGYIDTRSVQQLIRSRALLEMPGATSCMLLKCAACMYAKVKKRPSGASVARLHPGKDGALKKGGLFPGQRGSCNHFLYTVPGRLWTSRNKSAAKYIVAALSGPTVPPATLMFVLKSPPLLQKHFMPNFLSSKGQLHVGARSSDNIRMLVFWIRENTGHRSRNQV